MRVLGVFLFLLINFFSAAESYNLFEENGKIGLKNQQGDVLIPARYESLGWSNNSFSVIDRVTGYKLNGLWGLINLSNHTLTKPFYYGLLPGDGSLLLVQKKDINNHIANGVINTSGKEIIPAAYDGLKISSLHIVAFNRVGSKFKYGLIDLSNKKLIPLEYKDIHSIGSLRYAIENFQNKVALFTETGKQLTAFTLDSISAFHKKYAIIYDHIKQGLIDRDGVVHIAPDYNTIEIKPDGSVAKKQADEWSFLDGRNQLLRTVQCDSIEAVRKGIYKLTIRGGVQLVDQQLKPINTSFFSALEKFKNKKAIFKQGSKYGLIRQNGSIIAPAGFDALLMDGDCFIGNKTQYGKDQWFLIDSLGRPIHTKKYQQINFFNGQFYPVKNYNYWGALDRNGKEIVACVYDSLLQNFNNNVVVKFHGQYGIITQQENWLVTPQPNLLRLIDETHYLEFTDPTTFLKSTDKNIIYFTDNKIEVFPDHLKEHLPSEQFGLSIYKAE